MTILEFLETARITSHVEAVPGTVLDVNLPGKRRHPAYRLVLKRTSSAGTASLIASPQFGSGVAPKVAEYWAVQSAVRLAHRVASARRGDDLESTAEHTAAPLWPDQIRRVDAWRDFLGDSLFHMLLFEVNPDLSFDEAERHDGVWPWRGP